MLRTLHQSLSTGKQPPTGASVLRFRALGSRTLLLYQLVSPGTPPGLGSVSQSRSGFPPHFVSCNPGLEKGFYFLFIYLFILLGKDPDAITRSQLQSSRGEKVLLCAFSLLSAKVHCLFQTTGVSALLLLDPKRCLARHRVGAGDPGRNGGAHQGTKGAHS